MRQGRGSWRAGVAVCYVEMGTNFHLPEVTMSRAMFPILILAGVAAQAADPPPPPTLYELVINGESFTVEANRAHKLQSKKNPAVTYEVALRVAQIQRLALNRVHLDYDRGYTVADDANANVRTATLKHELGYSIVLSDVGRGLDQAGRRQVLDTLQKSMEKSFRDDKAENLKTAARHERKFQHADAEGVTMQYHDAAGTAHTCLLYVLAGKDFTATAIVQFQDADHENVLPLVKKTLDSVQPR